MLSIIIPTYNREASLKKCIDSVLPQYHDGIEVIIIDDCSTDGTAAYLEQLAHRHPFIRMFFNSVNKGVNFSRNRGIEKATKRYIFFLDSDDELAEGCLAKVESVMQANPAVKHFLFVVSDRTAEFMNVIGNRQVQFEDWVGGKVYGDFTHVVDAAVMKRFLFFEQFRTFEHLNWLRVKKMTAPQLLVPLVTAERERDRNDCLTNTMRLRNGNVIRSKFESEKMYYSMYYDDLKRHNPASLSNQLLHAITLGAACNKKTDSRRLLRYADKAYIKVMGNFLLLFPPSVLKQLIIRYSTFRNR